MGRKQEALIFRHITWLSHCVLLLAVLLAQTTEKTWANPTEYDAWHMSGLATNALTAAYHKVRMGDDARAPLVLQGYYVSIRTRGDYFEVIFCRETTTKYLGVFIVGRTGEVVSSAPDIPDRGLVLLPGTVAGAIIAAHNRALSKNELGERSIAALTSGAYNLAYAPGGGGTTVILTLIPQPVGTLTTQPAPTFTPDSTGLKCVEGNCTGAIVYMVTIRNNTVQVRSHAII
jgi:hypothetical protein